MLAERDADAPVEPASLTKLMTAYLVFDALRDKKLTLEQTLPVSQRAWDERKGGGSLMFIDTTMTPTVDDLLHGHDRAERQRRHGGAGRRRRRHGRALRRDDEPAGAGLGAEEHHLQERHRADRAGPQQHRARPGDRSPRASSATSPSSTPYYSIKEYRYNNITQPNRNLLLRRDPTVDGMKTGYTEAAGYCLMATAQREFPNLGRPAPLASAGC